MRTDKLITNITDQIKEAQLKLGFAREMIRLYFPLDSMNAILETEFHDTQELKKALNEDPAFVSSPLKQTAEKGKGNRIEIRVPDEGVEYVHRMIPDPEFLKTIIRLFETNHCLTIEEISGCFESFNAGYRCEKMDPDTDFDYAVYFPDKDPDGYYYCIKMEMGHTIYHRFMEEDFRMLLNV